MAPAVDLVEKESEYELTAELLGMDEKTIELKISNGMLTIRGEKREEKEEKKKGYFLSERRYGSFERSFRLPEGVETDKITATTKIVNTARHPLGIDAWIAMNALMNAGENTSRLVCPAVRARGCQPSK